MMTCDALLMLGTDFPYRQFYPTDAKIAQVDIRGGNLGRRCRLSRGLVGDVAATVDALLARLQPRNDRRHLDEHLAHYREARTDIDALAVGHAGRGPIHPQFLAKTLSDLAAEDAVISFDVGTPAIWTARYIRVNGRRRGQARYRRCRPSLVTWPQAWPQIFSVC
jgi:pyruvate dehydrogenase (quinone)